MVANSYAGRNVINAPAIKKSIRSRSVQRGDADNVQAWLKNHFFRYVIGNLQAEDAQITQVTALPQAEQLLGGTALPDWIQQHLKHSSSDTLWWIDPQGEELLKLEGRLVEFLSSRKGTALEGKLMRVNCFQALAMWATEHALFESKAAIGWREHQPTAVKEIWRDERGAFVEFVSDSPELRAEMAYESQMMRHCLGQFANKRTLQGGYGEHYAESCEKGEMRLFSYRTGSQHPHITISAYVKEDGKLLIDQIKGKQNRPPIGRYQQAVLGLLNQLETVDSTPSDALDIGLLRFQYGWDQVENIQSEQDQLWVVTHYPALSGAIQNPSLLVQWLMLAVQPSALQGKALASMVAKVYQDNQS